MYLMRCGGVSMCMPQAPLPIHTQPHRGSDRSAAHVDARSRRPARSRSPRHKKPQHSLSRLTALLLLHARVTRTQPALQYPLPRGVTVCVRTRTRVRGCTARMDCGVGRSRGGYQQLLKVLFGEFLPRHLAKEALNVHVKIVLVHECLQQHRFGNLGV